MMANVAPVISQSKCRTGVHRIVEMGTASQHTIRLKLVLHGIGCCTGASLVELVVINIETPLGNVAVHVEQAEGVLLVGADTRGAGARFGILVSRSVGYGSINVGFAAVAGTAEMKRRRSASSANIFPLGFGRQSIAVPAVPAVHGNRGSPNGARFANDFCQLVIRGQTVLLTQFVTELDGIEP